MIAEMIAQARSLAPEECCGLIGSSDGTRGTSLYPARNLARNRVTEYEASPDDLFASQREMRNRKEKLLAIYHSHPGSADPRPSPTDIRLAYYPDAIYFIIGLGTEPIIRAFSSDEGQGSCAEVSFQIVEG
jgi:[CysO sulfur-carrier protein]-S-L-cysteine hydrolase